MKLFLCAALGALSMLVSPQPLLAATPTCSPNSTSAANFEQTTQPVNLAKALSIDATTASFVVSWYCDEKYGWSRWYFYGYRNELPSNWQAILASAPKLTLTDINTLWVANSATPDPTLDVIAHRQLEATRPPSIVWRVRLNGTQTSRPVFKLNTDGTRNLTALTGERVRVGDQCSCGAKAIEEPVTGAAQSNVYCTVEGRQNAAKVTTRLGSNRFAWCERQ